MSRAKGNRDILVAKYTSTGSLKWVISAGGFEEDAGNGLAVLLNQNGIVVTGTFHGEPISTSIGRPMPSPWRFDPTSGHIHLTGSFQSNADFDQNETTDASTLGNRDAFVAKYEDDGDFVWANRAGGSSDDRGLGISVTSDGSQLYATGLFQGDAEFDGDQSTETSGIGAEDIYLASYNNDGNPRWPKAAGGNLDDRDLAATTSPNGNQVYVTSLFRNKPDFNGDGQQEMAGGGTRETSNIFVASYDGGGSLIGASPATSSENNAGRGLDVTSGDTETRVYLTGYYASGHRSRKAHEVASLSTTSEIGTSSLLIIRACRPRPPLCGV